MKKKPTASISKYIFIILFLSSQAAVYCQSAACDSIVLNEVLVKGYHPTPGLMTDSTGASTISVNQLNRMPKFLGSSNPMQMIQTLAGVHTNSEYDSGLRINGCESSQTAITLNGVPVYGVNHLLGFFSVFNPSHFASVYVQRNSFANKSAQRLGAEVDMRLPDISVADNKISAEGTVGLMSAQGTFRFKPRDNSMIIF